jgi:hypothetical protein
MLRGSDVERKSDIIVATSAARGLMEDYEGLIPVTAQSELYFVVDCPSLHIVSGNYLGPGRQSETDVGLDLSQMLYATGTR